MSYKRRLEQLERMRRNVKPPANPMETWTDEELRKVANGDDLDHELQKKVKEFENSRYYAVMKKKVDGMSDKQFNSLLEHYTIEC